MKVVILKGRTLLSWKITNKMKHSHQVVVNSLKDPVNYGRRSLWGVLKSSRFALNGILNLCCRIRWCRYRTSGQKLELPSTKAHFLDAIKCMPYIKRASMKKASKLKSAHLFGKCHLQTIEVAQPTPRFYVAEDQDLKLALRKATPSKNEL